MKVSKQILFIFSLILITFFVTENLFAQVEFIENKGQWDPRVKFKSNAGSGAFYLTEKGFTVAQYNPQDVENIKIRRHEGISVNARESSKAAPINNDNKVRTHTYSMEFMNSQSPQIIPDKPSTSVNNYFIGNDKTKWASNCKIYLGVTYQNIYKGIDVRYYVDGGGNLKYDFIVHPGADVNNIAMKYSGTNKITVKKRELNIITPLGTSRELKPYTYQLNNNERQELDCRYEVKDNVVKFKVKNYSPDKTLIIDPTEIFFSYSGSKADNWGFTATYGPDGSFYGGGIVFGEGFPFSSGYDQTFNGDFDIGIIKLTPNGRNMVYTTYIGGKGEEQPHSLIVDAQGNLILAGRSNSNDYPTTTKVGPNGGWDIVVTKLNASGSALIGSVKIGGTGNDGVNIADENSGSGTHSLKRNYGDDARSEVLLDASNNIYVASCSSSSDFPTTAGAFQTKPGGNQDAVVLKIDPSCNTVLFSTLLGGSGDDAAYVVALGNNNNIYVAGGTASDDFDGVSKSGVLNSTFLGGVCDGFVTEMNNSGTAVIRGTYIGTPQADQIYGIDKDKSGNIYVMGTSEGNMKVINAKYFNPGSKQFITKLAPDLDSVIYQTTFGSANALLPNISPTAFLVDRCENVYVSGWGGKSNQGTGFGSGNTKGMPTTPNAIKPVTDASGSDFYFFVMKKNADSLLYGTFFGQEDPPLSVKNPDTFGDHVDGGTSRFDRNGVIYQAMCANCFETVTFNGTPGVWGPRNLSQGNNGRCNLGMLKIEMNFAGVQAGLQSSIDGRANDTSGCIPLLVNFSDTLKKGKLYYWYFGDGTGDTTTVPAASHTYTNVGVYHVMLVSIDSLTCNISDTSYGYIKAGNNKANLDFISQKLPPCTNLSYSFTNTSSPTFGSFGPDIFTWDFGDNSPLVTQSQAPPVIHSYAAPGTYKVTLTINDTTYCNSPGDTVKTIRLSPQLQASFSTPAAGCVPYNAVFINNSLGGLNFAWNFGDGTTSTDDNPTHLYTQTGTYKITLTAYDSTSCNQIDDTTFTITVSPNPTASFTYNPNPPKENTFTNFVNQSVGATTYLWNFGDGDTSALTNPTHLFGSTGTFNVCLQVTNNYGCSADTCENVAALIRPLVDVPSAFTPGKFGVNSSIRVVGFGISQMHWSIYNRWGQKVFETTSTKSSWDGTFQGKLQPMDVYAYTLDVTFSDGKKFTKTGDITLLR
ncbi:MAG TPA: PKD domain-containing protein [Hanamia sp.]|nr:PKD domain-containing protein [Hanamia sp.]